MLWIQWRRNKDIPKELYYKNFETDKDEYD